MKTERPRVHLVTFATPRFYHRQLLLGFSASVNGVVDTVTVWSPGMLNDAGFQKRVPDISFSERGVGYWSWKPFIIQKRLNEVRDGDIVFYCDVGRRFPYTLLDQPVTPFIQWMDSIGQDMMPGVENTWDGPVCYWTKRDALVSSEMDKPEIHKSTIIQAGFSFWRAGEKSRELIGKWMDLCSQRELVSDDPSVSGLPELPEFREHRHDQSLLTLLCLKEGVKGLRFIESKPAFESGNPSEVLKYKYGKQKQPVAGLLFDALIARPIQTVEVIMRKKLKFN